MKAQAISVDSDTPEANSDKTDQAMNSGHTMTQKSTNAINDLSEEFNEVFYFFSNAN